MMKMPMSPAAAALVRALLARAEIGRDRILLSGLRSTDWQSLTFVGERHELDLRITGPDASLIAEQLTAGLPDAELVVPGQIVADIGAIGEHEIQHDNSVRLQIEALTIIE